MSESQITGTVFMIRPRHFQYNPETAGSNTFQRKEGGLPEGEIEGKAREEFDEMVLSLRNSGIEVLVYEDTDKPKKPDAVFPNNWITTHEDGSLITYPMHAPSRRAERREDIITDLEKTYEVTKRYSFENSEEQDMFLEGTGSMVLDRQNRVVYACLSPRTDIRLLDRFALLMDYKKCIFHAYNDQGRAIYHTNVIMALGEEFAVLCTASITDVSERKRVLENLKISGKEVIDISFKQMHSFSGNMLQLQSKGGDPLIAVSVAAMKSLDREQLERLEYHGKLLPVKIPTIENYGGGSVRCMIAEIFLERQ